MPAKFYVSNKCGEYMKSFSGKQIKVKCLVVETRKELDFHYISRGTEKKAKEFGHYVYNCELRNFAAIINGQVIYIKKNFVFENVKSFSEYENTEVTFYVDFNLVKSERDRFNRYICTLKFPKRIVKINDSFKGDN